MPTIKFIKEKKTIEVPEGANLRQEAFNAGIDVYPFPNNYVNCLGYGMCTSCKMNITKGEDNVTPQKFWEKLWMCLDPIRFGFFSRLGREKQIRSSCQTRVMGDIEVETQPGFNWHGERFWG